jgi:hypothetical protein
MKILQRVREALTKPERHDETRYEIFRDCKPKYQLIWTNHSKKFLIDNELVSEETWTKALKGDKP